MVPAIYLKGSEFPKIKTFMEAFVRLFFTQGRVSDLEQAYRLSPQETARLLLYWRDRNKGLGRRNLFYLAVRFLVDRDPSFLQLLPQIPKYGCWKDLVILATSIPTALEPSAQLFAQQLKQDQAAMRAGHYISTAAKWFPSSHAIRGRSAFTQRVQELLAVTEEQMRRTYLSPLRHYLQIAERQLSAREPVNYRRATRGANERYAQTFRRRDAGWMPPPVIPHSLLEVVRSVLRGQLFEADNYWARYQKSATGVGMAVVCDPRVPDPSYPIALSLASGKEGIYTYSTPSVLIKFPPASSLALRVAALQASRTGPTLSLTDITAPCIVVVTLQPLPATLPTLLPGQRLLWWRAAPTVAVREHSPYHIEICGFTPKLFSTLAKGHVPALTHIVASTLEKYTCVL
jgi:hypothetical protein